MPLALVLATACGDRPSLVGLDAPSGEHLFSVGRSGEGPGDFAMPYRIHSGDSGFYVRDQVRFSYFSDDGILLRTVPSPPTSVGYQGFPIRFDALAPDGTFLGFPTMGASTRVGLWGDDPIDSLPVRQAVRDRIEEALLVPGEYLPAVRRLFTASSGQVWLLSYETSGDTLGVWYSVERGDTVTPPRRVLLPEWFLVLDATDTHVWGVWRDELDINYVVGRRLVSAS